jgi:hypothetical protein
MDSVLAYGRAIRREYPIWLMFVLQACKSGLSEDVEIMRVDFNDIDSMTFPGMITAPV